MSKKKNKKDPLAIQKGSEDDRLLKLLKMAEPLRAELQLITSPALFNFIEAICKGYLEADRNSNISRNLIAKFAFAFRHEAFLKFGHDTLETFALAKLLRATEPEQKRAGRLDAVSYINSQKQKSLRFSAEEVTAAEYIIEVWKAFGKFRMIGGRGIDGGGGGKSQILQPLDVMGEKIWKHHKEIYSPWYEVAKKITIARLRGQGAISMAAIIFKVLIEDYYPDGLDEAFGLCRGDTLKAVKAGLSCYWSPEKLKDWDKRARAPRTPAGRNLPAAKGQAPKAA